MTTLQKKIQQLRQRVAERKSEAAGIGAVYKFIFEGDEGGTWIFRLKPPEPDLLEEDGPSDCTLRLSVEDGLALFNGKAKGQELFFSGRLKIEGDVMLALRLQALIDVVKE